MKFGYFILIRTIQKHQLCSKISRSHSHQEKKRPFHFFLEKVNDKLSIFQQQHKYTLYRLNPDFLFNQHYTTSSGFQKTWTFNSSPTPRDTDDTHRSKKACHHCYKEGKDGHQHSGLAEPPEDAGQGRSLPPAAFELAVPQRFKSGSKTHKKRSKSSFCALMHDFSDYIFSYQLLKEWSQLHRFLWIMLEYFIRGPSKKWQIKKQVRQMKTVNNV